jgi:hypothetical protein
MAWSQGTGMKAAMKEAMDDTIFQDNNGTRQLTPTIIAGRTSGGHATATATN